MFSKSAAPEQDDVAGTSDEEEEEQDDDGLIGSGSSGEEEEEDDDEEKEEGASSSSGEEEDKDGAGGRTGAAAVGTSGVDPGCPVVSSRDPVEAANVVRKHYRIKVRAAGPHLAQLFTGEDRRRAKLPHALAPGAPRRQVAGSEPPAPLRSWHELLACAHRSVSAAAAAPRTTAAAAAPPGATAKAAASGDKQGPRKKGASAKGAGQPPPKAGPDVDWEEEARHAERAAERLVGRLATELLAPQPTPIQRQAVPALLQGRELLAVAPTGAQLLGRNARASLPRHACAVVRSRGVGVRAVVHAPT